MAFNPDGSRLAIGSLLMSTVYILETDSDDGRVLARLDNPTNVFHLAWNPRRPNLLAVGLEDNTIRIWNVDGGRPTVTLEGDSFNGLVVAFHPGGEMLASRGWSGVLRLWDIRTGRQILSIPSGWLPELHFARDGSRLSAQAAESRAEILELSYQSECRSLVRGPGLFSSYTSALAIDHSGRLLAASCANGIALWDLPTGTPLAIVPASGEVMNVRFDPAGSLLTGRPMTLRWPISARPDGPTIGPPQLLQWYQTGTGFLCSRDGGVVAMALYNGGGLVFDADQPTTSRRFLHHRDSDTRGIALSPDGRWAVTNSHADGTLRVWDARTGRMIRDSFENPRSHNYLFSPDGRSLAIYVQNETWELVDIETWKTIIRLGGAGAPVAFSPDSAIFASETYSKSHEGSIALIEVATGRELARLDDPDGAHAVNIVFSPDSRQLIIMLNGQPYIRIWDLRAVRRRLAELNLDWSPPPAWESAVPPTWDFQLPPPPKYRVDRGQLDQWIKVAPIKRLEQAVADGEELLKHEPGQAEARDWLAQSCNNLAWKLVAGSESDRNPARAVPLARRAIELAPENGTFLNTLGLALHRAGQHAEAIPVLEQSLGKNSNDSAAYDLFFLSLCHAKQGDTVRARAYFDRAVTCLETKSNPSAATEKELRAFRAEAEALLRASFGVLPDDVFAKVPGAG
jgi:WD40 repeat protein